MIPTTQNQFLITLNELDEGNLPTTLHTQLKKCVAAVMETHKAATLTLKVKVSQSKKEGLLIIEPAVTTKLPAKEPSTTFVYANDDFELSRDDPRQPKLPGTGPAAVRDFRNRAAGDEE